MRKKQSRTTPAPHANKRSGPQMDNDLQEIAKLSLRGCTEQGIADSLNSRNPYQLSRSQVHADLVKLRKSWSEAAMDDAGEQFGQELEKLNAVEKASWEKFDALGEPAFLTLVLKSIQARVQLLGLSHPVQQHVEVCGPGGIPFYQPQCVLEVPERGTLDRDA